MAKGANVKGLKELQAKFKKLEREAPKVAERAGLAGGLIIQELAVMKVPKVSGTLSRSITVRVASTNSRITVRIGTNLEYARRIEFGFNDTDSLGRRFNQPAQPYLRPAFDQGKAKALAEIRAALIAQLNAI